MKTNTAKKTEGKMDNINIAKMKEMNMPELSKLAKSLKINEGC